MINDFKVLQKVLKKQGQNLPLASLYRINIPCGVLIRRGPGICSHHSGRGLLLTHLSYPGTVTRHPGCLSRILVFPLQILDHGSRVKKTPDLGAATVNLQRFKHSTGYMLSHIPYFLQPN
jgi:hypothetical protein